MKFLTVFCFLNLSNGFIKIQISLSFKKSYILKVFQVFFERGNEFSKKINKNYLLSSSICPWCVDEGNGMSKLFSKIILFYLKQGYFNQASN